MRKTIFPVALSIHLCLWGAFAQATSSAQEQPPTTGNASPPTAEELLNQSYTLGREFLPLDRRVNLVRLIQVAAKIKSPLVRNYVDEVFQISQEPSPGWAAPELQRTVLILFAPVDPEGAFELFQVMEGPSPGSENEQYDPRIEAAAIVFPQLWSRKGSRVLDALRIQAQRLGESGNYPYAAMASVISSLAETEPLTAQSIFLEAVTYYRAKSPSFVSDEQFIAMLQGLKDKMPAVLMKGAVQATVARLLEKAKSTPSGEKTLYRARLHTDKGVVSFENRAEELLFSMLPLVDEVDPEQSRDLLQERPNLARASSAAGELKHRESVLLHRVGGADAPSIDAAEEKALEESRFVRIQSLLEEDPEEALRLSLTLQNRSLRAAAFGYLAATFAAQDRDKAVSLTTEARELLAQVESSTDKVRTLASLARAAAALEDRLTLQKVVGEGLEIGVEVFEQEMDTHPGWTPFQSDVIEPLSELIRVSARTDVDSTIAYVQGLQNEPLKAWLLLDIAQVLGTPKSTPPTPPDQP